MKILVTGANGFIGETLSRHLAAAGHDVIGGVRSPAAGPAWMETRTYGDLETLDDASSAVTGVDAIVHLAARVHMMRETDSDPDTAYRRANATVTEKTCQGRGRRRGRAVCFSELRQGQRRTHRWRCVFGSGRARARRRLWAVEAASRNGAWRHFQAL